MRIPTDSAKNPHVEVRALVALCKDSSGAVCDMLAACRSIHDLQSSEHRK